MTESEAIKDIKENILPSAGGKSLILAISALEKQIPKKPMISYDERVKENWRFCGVCAFGLGWKRTIHYKYCPDCGHKLNWG